MPILFHALAIVCVVLVAGLYWLGMVHSYFWLIWWYDIPLHLLGGVAVGLLGVAMAARRNYSPRQALALVLVLIAVVGVAWELFEYFANLTRADGYWLDTVKDLLDDIIGTFLPLLVYRMMYIRRSTSTHE